MENESSQNVSGEGFGRIVLLTAVIVIIFARISAGKSATSRQMAIKGMIVGKIILVVGVIILSYVLKNEPHPMLYWAALLTLVGSVIFNLALTISNYSAISTRNIPYFERFVNLGGLMTLAQIYLLFFVKLPTGVSAHISLAAGILSVILDINVYIILTAYPTDC